MLAERYFRIRFLIHQLFLGGYTDEFDFWGTVFFLQRSVTEDFEISGMFTECFDFIFADCVFITSQVRE